MMNDFVDADIGGEMSYNPLLALNHIVPTLTIPTHYNLDTTNFNVCVFYPEIQNFILTMF